MGWFEMGACPSNRRVAIPASAGNFWHASSSGGASVPDTDGAPRSRAAEGGGKKHAALQGGSEMPRLVCCWISQNHYLESARFSAAHLGHFRAIAIPAITRTARRGEPRGLTAWLVVGRRSISPQIVVACSIVSAIVLPIGHYALLSRCIWLADMSPLKILPQPSAYLPLVLKETKQCRRLPTPHSRHRLPGGFILEGTAGLFAGHFLPSPALIIWIASPCRC